MGGGTPGEKSAKRMSGVLDRRTGCFVRGSMTARPSCDERSESNGN